MGNRQSHDSTNKTQQSAIRSLWHTLQYTVASQRATTLQSYEWMKSKSHTRDDRPVGLHETHHSSFG